MCGENWKLHKCVLRNEIAKRKKTIDKQNNITTKVKNLRYNPSRGITQQNIYNVYNISTNISEVSPLNLDETTPRVRLFRLQNKAIRFRYEILKGNY